MNETYISYLCTILYITVALIFTSIYITERISNKINEINTNLYYQPSNNKIIKLNYNQKDNLFSVLYTKDKDIIGLDDIYPIELDSLVKTFK